jgi:DNA polymerase II small subunit/DNA polymerase delta subunit B
MKTLLNEYGVTKKQLQSILRSKKAKKPKVLKRYISDNVFKFGAIADTHFCSREDRVNELHTFYQICKKSGIKHIFHAGDIIAGWGIYAGQENEVTEFGAHNQAQKVIDQYPKVEGITTYFITGNHCLSFYKRSGVDVGKIIASKRPDMVYLGQYAADCEFNGIKIRLLHPDGGGAYAISYSVQKLVEKMSSGTKPHIFIVGHDHTAFYSYIRNVHCIRPGCFEGQTTFLLRKGIMPAIGGFTCEARKGKGKDAVVALTSTFINFF